MPLRPQQMPEWQDGRRFPFLMNGTGRCQHSQNRGQKGVSPETLV